MIFKKYIMCILVFFTILGCDNKASNNKDTSSNVNTKKEISPIQMNAVNGANFTIQKTKDGLDFSDIKEKAILLTFFATWCESCKAEIPHLNSLQNKYKDKLKIIGILLEDKDLSEIQSFIKSNDINYEITYGNGNFDLAKAIGGVNNIPFMVLYYPDGKYAYHYVGIVLEEMLEADISKVLGNV